jgi:general secretion pathway protein J
VTLPYTQRGFTLIEVLIGATLLAVMMLLLGTALFTLTRGARAGETRLEQLDSAQVVVAFLTRELAGALPMTERVDGKERVLFNGEADRIRFVGHLPSAQAGGLQFVQLSSEADTASSALLLRYVSASPETPFVAPNANWHVHPLLPKVRRLRYAYYGDTGDDAPPQWHDEWRDHDRLPELIRVELESASGVSNRFVTEVRVRTAIAQGALFREPPGGSR